MEMNVMNGVWVPTLDSELGLAVVDGGADEVDRHVVGGDKAGEVEELVEMALCWQRHHDYLNLVCHD